MLPIDEVKRLVVQRKALQKQRDAMTEGLSPESIAANPMALVTKLPSLLDAFKLTAEVEKISDQLVADFVYRLVAAEKEINERVV